MERKEIIDGLKDLIKDRESFITEGEPESWKTDTDKIFEHDKQVLEEAINTIEAQQQEIDRLKELLADWKYNTKCDADHIAAITALAYREMLEEVIKHLSHCPFCKINRPWLYKHKDGCKLAALLKESEVEEG